MNCEHNSHVENTKNVNLAAEKNQNVEFNYNKTVIELIADVAIGLIHYTKNWKVYFFAVKHNHFFFSSLCCPVLSVSLMSKYFVRNEYFFSCSCLCFFIYLFFAFMFHF